MARLLELNIIIKKSPGETAAYFSKVLKAVNEQQRVLYTQMGEAVVENVKRRIITSDGGTWAPPSKWLVAKTGQTKVLKGAERYVRYAINAKGVQIKDKGGKWNLTKHHEGFENALADPSEEMDGHGRVILQIKDPRPLNLYTEMRKKRDGSSVPIGTTFAFVPKKPGRTPARKIWPTPEETQKIVQPLASKWLKSIVDRI